MSNKPCAKVSCGELVPRGTRFCAKHQKEFEKENARNWDKNPSPRSRAGKSKGYDKKRNYVKRRDGGLCQACLAAGIYQQGKEVDHIVPVSQGGSDSTANLQLLCVPHHREKTKRERLESGRQ